VKMTEDEYTPESPNFHALDSTLAKASGIDPVSAAEKKVLAAHAQALAAVEAQYALNVERITAHRTPVEPGKMSKRNQPSDPYYGSLCAVNKCQGLSEGGYVEVSPPDMWRDPIANPQPVSDDDWEDQAIRQDEETRLRALNYSTDLVSQIERAQMFVRAAQAAHQVISTVVLPLCSFHAEHRDATISAGFKKGALPLKFGAQR
jgi:hypothetical protein